MKDILSAEGRRALEELASANVLLGFDYDGTLAPIVARPDQARMRPSTRALLFEVSGRYPCAVVTGRSRRDVLPFLEELPLLRLVGNHGAEWEELAPALPRKTIARWHAEMISACKDLPGVLVEDKTWSVAVHWRGARRKSVARARILAAASAIEGARALRGKEVVNLVHPEAAHKGVAVVEARRQLGCDAVIYVGDDVTDEDVFALGEPGRLLTVRVGRSRRTRAAFFLSTQAQIDELLATLLSLRPAARRTAS
jgi:trehalose 6-phosphate phosphatase